ncbi:hypothetical protein [Streptomyces sp. HC307]|uniref:hypothetical protein n=1 Tax=Streptomyces flavusporus TaxID=3385496 RepID=UPI003916D028
MTLNLIPAALKGHGRRRAVDEVGRLREDNIKLLNRQAAADDYFAILQQNRREVYEAWQFAEHGRQAAEAIVVDQERQIRDLKRQLADTQRRLDIGVKANAAADQTQPIPVITPVPLHQAPMAVTDPGHVPPSWARGRKENA